MAIERVVPSHVSPERVWDGDIAEFPRRFDDPYTGVCDFFHQGPDIVWAATNAHFGRPGWLLTRYALLQEAYMDSDRFPVRFNRGASDMLGTELPLLPFESDPPDHRFYRQLIQPFFQPSSAISLEPMVRDVCRRLIGDFQNKGGCEFIGEFASLFPSHIFIHMFGLPTALVPQFLEWEHDFLCGTIETQVAATRSIYEFLRDRCEEKRKNPGQDLFSTVVTGEIQGRRMTDAEVHGMAFLLFAGGLDTVTSSLGWYFQHLASNSALQTMLRDDPGLIPDAVEELLRAYPVSNTNRTVASDMEFHGVPMRKGDIVALPTFLGARDARQFPNPHVVDIGRKPRHMTFGTGAHVCLGAHLARREIKIVLAEMLARFRNIRIPQGARPEYDFAATWSVKKLRLEWDPT